MAAKRKREVSGVSSAGYQTENQKSFQRRREDPHRDRRDARRFVNCRAVRREGIHPTMYYKWSKEFMEAGKKRLNGDTQREATPPEVQQLRNDNEQLKQLVAELSWTTGC